MSLIALDMCRNGQGLLFKNSEKKIIDAGKLNTVSQLVDENTGCIQSYYGKTIRRNVNSGDISSEEAAKHMKSHQSKTTSWREDETAVLPLVKGLLVSV
ncbi:hypothetical protein OS493_010758 [Desmophyllum pertusum]|uniref:Uncharacterized protein n=1 Tax=Desmophyllum pertusum TaxID=174260 RepID=A0A9X0CYC5_9CNID|nr:hypothetical protein OS493_010758 [Desmophyllum pertusum]